MFMSFFYSQEEMMGILVGLMFRTKNMQCMNMQNNPNIQTIGRNVEIAVLIFFKRK